MPDKPAEIQVSVVIVYDGPLMLVNKRPPGSYFGGWWEWPGGKREPGENLRDCARRELKEEIGIDVGEMREIDRRRVEYPGRVVHLTFFVARRPAGAVASPDALEHRWLEPAQVRALKFLEPNLEVLEKLIENPPF